MGQAKRREVEIASLKARTNNWLISLPQDEKVVAEVAMATFNSVVIKLGMTEACYNLSFFLSEYLRRKHGIIVNVVVGWVNDGTWDGAASHAWLEYKGKKIDITLYKTSHPDIQPPGDLIVLDYIIQPGKVTYTYWQTLPEKAAITLELMRSSDKNLETLLKHKENEHQKMFELASRQDGAEEYLRQAPTTNNYEFLSRAVGT